MAIGANALAGTNIGKSAIEDRLAQELSFAIPEIDPVFSRMINAATENSSGRVRKEDLRNDYRIVMPVTVRQARGVVRFDPGETSLFGPDNTPFGRYGRNSEYTTFFPDPREDIKHRYSAFGVPMRAQTFTITFSFFEDMVDNLDAFEGSLRGNEMEGLAQNIMRVQCNHLYADQNDYFAYGTYDGADATLNSIEEASAASQTDVAGLGRDRLTVVLRERTEMRLVPGMQVDLVRVPGDTPSATDDHVTLNYISTTRCPGYVTRVDPLTGEVELEFWKYDSSTGWEPCQLGSSTVADDFDPLPDGIVAIVPVKNSVDIQAAPANRYGITGLHSYIKNTGNLLGDAALSGQTINVDSIPATKSLIEAIGGPLSEDVLIRHLETIRGRMSGYRQRLVDTVITTPGVLIAFNQTRLAGIQYVRGLTDTSVPTLNDVGFNWTGTTVQVGNDTIPIETSRYVSAGLLYGLPMGMQNWKIFTPPTGSVTGFKQLPTPGTAAIPVTAVGQYVGFPSEKVPILRTNLDYTQITDQYQIPGMIHYNICPEEPGGCLLLTGLTEDYVTASD